VIKKAVKLAVDQGYLRSLKEMLDDMHKTKVLVTHGI
jgi:hypothetical protein